MLLNGNQIVMILLNYIITRNKELGVLKGNEFAVKTIVTTETIKAICEAMNVGALDCYTGFKWIAAVMRDNEDDLRYLGGGEDKNRPTLINNNWGGTVEDNSFGTHEFFALCEDTGIEPYLSVNIGSGKVQEAPQWVEYVTAPNGPGARERPANGRTEPGKLKFIGIGNESWGCGGNMRPEYYADNYRRYSTYMRNQPENKLYT